jgi:osmotically-inducible protein OsmY
VNVRLENEIRATLDLDARIPAPVEVAVLGDGGIVRLRGTVGSFKQRRAAVEDAQSISGVYEVLDDLKVSFEDGDRLLDDELRGAALQMLIWDSEIPSDSVDVKVNDGWATLTGEVGYQFQSDDAYDHVAALRGVTGITNEIRVAEHSHRHKGVFNV